MNLSADASLTHFSPLSSRLLYSSQHLYVSMSKMQARSHQSEAALKILSKSFLVASYSLSALISLIEGVASGIFGLIGITLQLTLSPKHEMLERYSIKSLSFCLQNVVTLAICLPSIVCAIFSENEWAAPIKHTNVSTLSAISFLFTTTLAQLFCTELFNFIKGRTGNDTSLIRSNQAFREGLPLVFAKIVKSLKKEELSAIPHLSQDPQIFVRNYLSAHPLMTRDWIHNFCLDDFLNEHITQYLIDLTRQYTATEASALAEATGNSETVLNSYCNAEKIYHEHLKSCVTEAVRKIYSEQWGKYFDSKNIFEDGIENLASFMPDCTIPLANIAQLMEVQQANHCPKKFTLPRLKNYDDRNGKLESLRLLWEALPDNDKALLVERLIKTSFFELGTRRFTDKFCADQLYFGISALAGDLHQGPLLTLSTINTTSLETGGHNYFGDCWRDAIPIKNPRN